MGAGQWGTTFAQVLCDAGTGTELLARSAELAEVINSSHENPEYLPGIALPHGLHATGGAA
jgi:glycerol-3-phosphate dehydrogenase (NAD(P)+)